MSKLSEEKKTTSDEELRGGRVFAAAGAVSNVASLLLNPLEKGSVDSIFRQYESGQSILKLREWSPVTSPERGSPQPQENSGSQAPRVSVKLSKEEFPIL